MTELHIYRGLQGSGKSTIAAANALADGGRVVGRDKVRALMGVEGVGTNAQEHEVTKVQGELIAGGLKTGQNVHVDDMNLKAVYVRRLLSIAQKYDAEVKVHDLTNVSLETCLTRNLRRAENKGLGFVNEEVIRKNHDRFVKGKAYPLPMPTSPIADLRLEVPEPYVPDTSKPKAVLVDLDGTAALKWHGRGFHDYDSRVLFDKPNYPVIEVVRSLFLVGIDPIFVSGRKGNTECFAATTSWIKRHVSDVKPLLYMREPWDNRPDWLVKTDIFNTYIRNDWNVVAALDDRDQVVQRYRQLGLTVFQVADGNF